MYNDAQTRCLDYYEVSRLLQRGAPPRGNDRGRTPPAARTAPPPPSAAPRRSAAPRAPLAPLRAGQSRPEARACPPGVRDPLHAAATWLDPVRQPRAAVDRAAARTALASTNRAQPGCAGRTSEMKKQRNAWLVGPQLKARRAVFPTMLIKSEHCCHSDNFFKQAFELLKTIVSVPCERHLPLRGVQQRSDFWTLLIVVQNRLLQLSAQPARQLRRPRAGAEP